MVGVLLVVFLLVSVAELFVMVQMAGAIGVVPTLAILLAVSLAGAWLVKREGLGLLRRTQATLDRGELPGDELIDGVLLLAAGALLVVPGFISDAAGLVLLLPPVRRLARRSLVRRFTARLATLGVGGPVAGGGFGGARVYDVQYVGDVTPPSYRRSASWPEDGHRGSPPELGAG